MSTSRNVPADYKYNHHRSCLSDVVVVVVVEESVVVVVVVVEEVDNSIRAPERALYPVRIVTPTLVA